VEVTAQLFRVLANPARLRMLRALVVLGEKRVQELVEGAGRVQGRVSADLRALASAGLVWRRRSGRAIYYRIAETPRNPIVRAALALLRKSFADVPVGLIREVMLNEGDGGRTDAELLSQFSAYTHPRRLQIIRYLDEREEAMTEGITEDLSMSTQACLRHLGHLAERDIVAGRRTARGLVHCLAGPRDVEANRLFGILRAELSSPNE